MFGLGIAPIRDGYVRSLCLALILTAAASFAAYFSSLSEEYYFLLSLLIFTLSIFYGAAVAAKKAGRKGLYLGLSVSLLFMATTLLLAGIFLAGGFTPIGLVKKLLLGLLAGAVGGMFGLAFS